MSILERLTALLAPDDCLGCGREGSLVCGQCRLTKMPVSQQCFICYQVTSGAVCPQCLSRLPCKTVQTATTYAGVGKGLVAHLKFAQNPSAARIIAAVIRTRCTLPTDGVLTYVPANAAHVRERGFDQSELIVRELSRLTGLAWCRSLAREGTRHQLGSSRAERHQQLQGMIRPVHPRQYQAQHLILIDDVLTTGSSLLVTTDVLISTGAASVEAITFAQALSGQ